MNVDLYERLEKTMFPCQECHGTGLDMHYHPGHGAHITACQECQKFPNDKEAARFAQSFFDDAINLTLIIVLEVEPDTGKDMYYLREA